MHYHAEVYIPLNIHPFQVKSYIDRVMKKHQEVIGFDWYQIGGRWKGQHDPDYDSAIDKENYRDGKLMWSTQWTPHIKDVIYIGDLKTDFQCHTLVFEDSVFMIERLNGNDFVKTEFTGYVVPELKRQKLVAGFLVTVDYHV